MTTATLPKEGRKKLYRQIYDSLETELNSRSANDNPLEVKEISAILTLLDKLQDLAKDIVPTPRVKKVTDDDDTFYRVELTQRLNALAAAASVTEPLGQGSTETLG